MSPRPKRVVLSLAAAAVVAAFLYAGLPRLAGLDETWGRLSGGDPWWLGAAALLEAGSYAGYVVLFRGIFVRPGSPLRWRDCYLITMAGVAATRLLAAGGAGGVALTGWALARSGMDRRELAAGLTTFLVALYSVFMAALVLGGLGLRSGVLAGPAPFGLTVVPAAFGAGVIAAALLTALLPHDLGPRTRRRLTRHHRTAAVAGKLAAGAATLAAGVRGALGLLAHGRPALLGAVAWWAFDIAVLWACFRAFGGSPPVAVLVMGYFTGMVGNLLPLPGGIGGVEGGMIGAFLGFGVDGGLAVVAVLSYRAFAFWLPTVPGAVAYLQLRPRVRSWAAPSAPEPNHGARRPSRRSRAPLP
jgi:uncharacterized membrane protein YbhN (UPF0104 family)